MNLSQTFEAARPLAQHCAELTERGPRPEERSEAISAWRRDIGKSLTQELVTLFSGGRITAVMSEPEWLTGREAFERIGAIAANTLLRCGEADQTLLLSIDYPSTVALTDRSFGGEGEMPGEAPEALPRSAALLIDQVAKVIAGSITEASGGAPGDGDVIIRSESASRLKPYGADTQCALFAIELSTEDRRKWLAQVSLSSQQLDRMLPGLGAASSKTPAGAGNRGEVLEAPFSIIPLSLRAVLAELTLSLGQLERLKPGDQIPIAVPRDVPLRIGNTTLAHGTVGTQQDQMALQLTRTQTERSAP